MSIDTRRDFLCAELDRCMAFVVEALIPHEAPDETAAWQASWQLGSEEGEYPGEGRSFQKGVGTALVKVLFQSSDSETRDHAAGRATYIVEKCVRAYKATSGKFENDLYEVTVTHLDTGPTLPSFDENKINGKVFIPVHIYYNLQWKPQR